MGRITQQTAVFSVPWDREKVLPNFEARYYPADHHTAVVRRRSNGKSQLGRSVIVIQPIVSPLLAEDVGPVIMLAFFVPVGLGVITFGSVIVNKYWGRRKWWGLTLALIPTLLGGLI